MRKETRGTTVPAAVPSGPPDALPEFRRRAPLYRGLHPPLHRSLHQTRSMSPGRPSTRSLSTLSVLSRLEMQTDRPSRRVQIATVRITTSRA